MRTRPFSMADVSLQRGVLVWRHYQGDNSVQCGLVRDIPLPSSTPMSFRSCGRGVKGTNARPTLRTRGRLIVLSQHALGPGGYARLLRRRGSACSHPGESCPRRPRSLATTGQHRVRPSRPHRARVRRHARRRICATAILARAGSSTVATGSGPSPLLAFSISSSISSVVFIFYFLLKNFSRADIA